MNLAIYFALVVFEKAVPYAVKTNDKLGLFYVFIII